MQIRTEPARGRTSPRSLAVMPDPPAAPAAALTRAEIGELAARYLQAASQADRDHLLAAAMIHAALRTGGTLPRELGRDLGALLKPVGRSAVRRRTPLGLRTGLELEALEADDRAFRATQRFIRLSGVAAALAADAADSPGAAARAYAAATGAAPSRRAASFDYDPEMEYFLGGLVRSAAHAVRDVSRVVDRAAGAVGKIPVLGDVARAGLGMARLGMGPAAIAMDAGVRLAHGQKLGAAFKGAVGGQISAVRDQLKLAEMVAPFVPGIGPGIGAALGAANALAAGKPITEALVAAARSALPGGAVAQAAFDVATGLARGRTLGEAALSAARERLPGGAAARAGFDAAVALGKGKTLQDAAFAAAGRVLPASPYAADALDFVKRVGSGQNIQHAALSIAGKRALAQVRRQAQRETEYELTWKPAATGRATIGGVLDVEKLKTQVIAHWRSGGGNTLVKVMPKGARPMPGLMIGYCTTLKYVLGRTPAQMEAVLGFAPNTKLAHGAAIFLVRPLPDPSRFLLRSYTQMPDGMATNDPRHLDRAAYPPGLGAPQWNLERHPQSNLLLLATVEPGQVFARQRERAPARRLVTANPGALSRP